MTVEEIHRTIETVFRMERAKLIAGLARMVRDVSQAEELAQDALVTALSDWPKNGVPRNPGAWLMAAAKRRAIDGFRRNKMLKRKHEELGRDLEDERDGELGSARRARLHNPLCGRLLGAGNFFGICFGSGVGWRTTRSAARSER